MNANKNGRQRTFLALLLLGLLGDGIWQPADAQCRGLNALSPQYGPLKVLLSMDQSTYRISDVVDARVVIINCGQSPLYIYAELGWGEAASVSLWLKDTVSQRDVPVGIVGEPPPPPPTSANSFIKLLPDHIYGVVLRSTLADLGVTKIGRYDLLASYHSPIPKRLNFGLPIWSRENGAVLSKLTAIQVVK